ncbi:hypothetical protein KCTCHS21_33740 [Cohnella abietis]|uniref:Uncharacterized protein n=1 Tax=Cohnella abietis TaxID=2507935 RepID=A0A3T1D7E6_9BACL|nr:hypothetical protein KCTCHS21_33740 [Cohnella abietis]
MGGACLSAAPPDNLSALELTKSMLFSSPSNKQGKNQEHEESPWKGSTSPFIQKDSSEYPAAGDSRILYLMVV